MTDTSTPADAATKGFVGRMIDRARGNLGRGAWAESKVRTSIRGGGVVLGAVLIGHGLLKSQTVGDDGQPQSRGIGVRALETVGGAGLIAVSALAGGR